MGYGKLVKEEQKEVKLLGRDLIVWVKEFESGIQRSGAFFVDKSRFLLARQNAKLRSEIQELKKQLKKD